MSYFIVTSWNGQKHFSKEADKPVPHRLSAKLGVRESYFALTSAESALTLDALTQLYQAGTLTDQMHEVSA